MIGHFWTSGDWIFDTRITPLLRLQLAILTVSLQYAIIYFHMDHISKNNTSITRRNYLPAFIHGTTFRLFDTQKLTP